MCRIAFAHAIIVSALVQVARGGSCGSTCFCGGGGSSKVAQSDSPPGPPSGCRSWSQIKSVGDTWHNFNCGSSVTNCETQDYSAYKRCRDAATTSCFKTRKCNVPNVVYTMNIQGHSPNFFSGPPTGRYRNDCSGIASAMWGLSAPGLNTRSWQSATEAIPFNSMQPGDLYNSPGKHIVVFAGWEGSPGGRFWVYEESGSKGVVVQTWGRSSGYTARRHPKSCWKGSAAVGANSEQGGANNGADTGANNGANNGANPGVSAEAAEEDADPEEEKMTGEDKPWTSEPEPSSSDVGSYNVKPPAHKVDGAVDWWSTPPSWWTPVAPEWGSPEQSVNSGVALNTFNIWGANAPNSPMLRAQNANQDPPS